MFGGVDIQELFRQSMAMWLLLIISCFCIAFIIERLWSYFKWRMEKSESNVWFNRVKPKIERGENDELLKECRRHKHAAAFLLEGAMANAELPEEDVIKILEGRITKVQGKLENFLGALGTISSIAPLIGLFGTVVGIIVAFKDMALTGSGGATVVSMGVAQALVTTAFGILVAVPALVAYNFFAGVAANETIWLENMRDDITILMKKAKGPRK